MFLHDVFQIALQIFKNDILNQFPFLILTVEKVFNLYYVRTVFQNKQNLVFPTHPLSHLFNSL